MSLSESQQMQAIWMAQNTDKSYAEIAQAVRVRKIHVIQLLDNDYAARERERKRQERHETALRKQARGGNAKPLPKRLKLPPVPVGKAFKTRSGMKAVTVGTVGADNCGRPHNGSAQSTHRQVPVTLPYVSGLGGEKWFDVDRETAVSAIEKARREVLS